VEIKPEAGHARTMELAETPIRLKRLADNVPERLINRGYAVCDAALRKHVKPTVAKRLDFPCPAAGV
jgi:NTE family protein